MTTPLQPPPKNLDRIDLPTQVREMARWMYEVYRRLKDTGLLSVLYTSLDFTGSSLSSIVSRAHSQLQSVLGVTVTSTDTSQVKHVSDANGKKWEDGVNASTAHIAASSNVHSIGSGNLVVGTGTTQTIMNKDIRATYATSAINLTVSATVTKLTAAVTVTVPTASGVTGKEFILDNAATTECTVVPTGAETIEGETTQPLPPNSSMTIYSDGANWRIK